MGIDLRRLALIFDQIGLINSDRFLQLAANQGRIVDLPDLEMLQKEQFIVPVSDFSELGTEERLSKYQTEFSSLARQYPIERLKKPDDSAEASAPTEEDLHYLKEYQYRLTLQQARMISVLSREVLGYDAYPVWDDVTHALRAVPQDASATVMNVILTRFPMPDSSTSWNELLEFRRDPESRDKFRRLRLWISRTATTSSSPTVIEDMIETGIHEYEAHLKRHRLRVEYGIVQTLVLTAAGILEDVIHFKFSSAAERLFSIGEARLKLLEAEATAPGRELAYVATARERFR